MRPFPSPSPRAVSDSSPIRQLEDLGAKARVMELMGHPDPDVKYQSLVATQTLISSGFK